ncbi:MAG: ribonuclease HIII [Planctomycetota bacterium]
MSQRTLVVKLGARAATELEKRLEGEAFEWRRPPHSRFQVRGPGVTATLYTSGKLVVQGAEAEGFALRYLEPGAVPPAASPVAASPLSASPASDDYADVPTVGSDEAGKGDFFGPLVVCAVRLLPEDARALAAAGVVDGKRLSDARVLELGAALQSRYDLVIERLDPEDYNREYARYGNLNTLLAELHARALRPLLRDGDVAIVDQFGNERLVREALGDAPGRLVQRPRAEEITAVAAASVVARQEFLEGLRALSERFAVDLAKGAGTPVDAAARKFVALHGRDALGSVAKLHFKNAAKLAARR